MNYIIPLQICDQNFESKYNTITKHKGIFSCWCVNLSNANKIKVIEASNALLIENNIDISNFTNNQLLCENLIFKHIVYLLGLYSRVFLIDENYIIENSECVYEQFKRLEVYYVKAYGLLEQRKTSVLKLLEEYKNRNPQLDINWQGQYI